MLRSSSNESPPPEPKVVDLKSISHIPLPGTAEFDQRNDSKYLTVGGMGLKLEKDDYKLVDNKYPGNPSASTSEFCSRLNLLRGHLLSNAIFFVQPGHTLFQLPTIQSTTTSTLLLLIITTNMDTLQTTHHKIRHIADSFDSTYLFAA